MILTLSDIDYIIIYSYFAIILFAGIYFGKSKQHTSKLDLILGGRKLTLPLFVVSLVATWYGNILGVGEFVASSGIFAFTCFSLPYYICAVVYANMFSRKIREMEFSSLPELFTAKYGKNVGLASNIFIFIISLPSVYICILGVILSLVIGINLLYSMIISTILSTIYLYNSGLKADVVVNTIQFVLMYLGFAILFYFCFMNYGSLFTLSNSLVTADKQFVSSNNWQLLIVWFIVALQTFIDPSFYQRCAAAKNPQTAKKGIYWSILFWFIFDFLTISTALYAKAFIKDSQPIDLYFNLAEANLPVIAKGVFIISVLSAAMSTLSSYTVIAGNTFANIISHFTNNFDKRYNILFNFSITIAITLSIIIAYIIQSPLNLIYYPVSIVIPGLVSLTFIAFNNNYTLKSNNALAILVISNLVSLLFLINGKLNYLTSIATIEPMLAGIVVSIILGFLLVEKQNIEFSK